MRIAVTGGAGFIGSNLCDFLLGKGHAVTCIDNFNDYYSPAAKRHNIEHNLGKGSFKLVECDVREHDALLKAIKESNAEAIVHLAALPGVRASMQNPGLYIENNVLGTLNALEAAKESGIKRFVLASSSSVYGNSKKIPFEESDSADSQMSPYAFSKRSSELLCRAYHNIHGLDVACLRFFTVYGERNRPDMAVGKFMQLVFDSKPLPIYGSTDLERDYTYVGDILPAILAALQSAKGFEIVNLGNDNPIKLSRIISLIESGLGKKAVLEDKGFQKGDAKATRADIGKAKRLLGYNPSVSIEEGIERAVKWFLKEKGQA